MCVRMLGASLLVASLMLVGGCHSQSRYSACCAQPSVTAASPCCPNPATPPPGAVQTVVPGMAH